MLKTILFLYLALNSPLVSSTQNFGVGFNLNLDYGTAAIHYPNGTYFGIAKIEGSPSYKSLMRSQHWSMTNDISPSPPLPIPEGWHGTPYSTRVLTTICEQDYRNNFMLPLNTLHSLRANPTLCPNGYYTDVKDTSPLPQMLSALLTATESHTTQKIKSASLVFPAECPASLTKVIHSAAKKLDMNLDFTPYITASEQASNANRNRTFDCDENSAYCGEDGPWCEEPLVLTVELNRADMTAMLFDRCAGESLRSIRGSDLHLKDALREMVRIPVDRGEGGCRDRELYSGGCRERIDEVVLLGELGGDRELREILASLGLGVDFVMADSGKGVVEPLFAAAVGAAEGRPGSEGNARDRSRRFRDEVSGWGIGRFLGFS